MGMIRFLKTMPRDMRDTLFLLFVIAWLVAPLSLHIPIWATVAIGGCLLVRGYCAAAQRELPARRWLVLTMVIAFIVTWLNFRTFVNRDAGITLMAILLGIKTLEMRARRDAFVIFFLSFFAIVTNFLFSQQIGVAAFMVVGVWLLVTAMVNVNMTAHGQKMPLLQTGKRAFKLIAYGAPLMAFLFIMFPRIGPLWATPQASSEGKTGLSNRMEVGSVARLALDQTIAFRIKFNSTPPSVDQMYFRGPVLNRFDGREWTETSSRYALFAEPQDYVKLSSDINYEVTMDASPGPWLMVMDGPSNVPSVPGYDIGVTREMQWIASRTIARSVRYQATSNARYRSEGQGRFFQKTYLQVPPEGNALSRKYAQELKDKVSAQGGGPAELSRAVLEKFRTDGYTYSLQPGTYGEHTVDEFMFFKKVGFCEHIASAYVFLMRSMGVPARVVTGYQGATRNEVDGFWVVRQSNAHAWAEIWLEGAGWTRVDPTSYVAPARVSQLQQLAVADGVIARAMSGRVGDYFKPLRQGLDAINNAYTQFVLNYSGERQDELVQKLGFKATTIADLAYKAIVALIAGAVLVLGWYLVKKSREDRWSQRMARCRDQLRAKGYPIEPNATPRQIMATLANSGVPASDPTVQALLQWLVVMDEARYGPKDSGTKSSGSKGMPVVALGRMLHASKVSTITVR